MIPNNQFWFNTSSQNNNYIAAMGGTIVRKGNYLIHVLTLGDEFEITQLAENPAHNELSVTLIGGGGGGGKSNWAQNEISAGGGAGQFLQVTKTAAIKKYTFTIGIKGECQQSDLAPALNGGDTVFEGSTALGGGGAGWWGPGKDGASGGGGSRNYPGGLGLAGYKGGDSLNINNSAGSGGGAGGPGLDAPENSSNVPGGPGIYIDVSGETILYCKGGGANITSTVVSDYDGPDGLGWGGAGGSATSNISRGGFGSSGSIIIKYFCPVNYYYRLTYLSTWEYPWLDSACFCPINKDTLGIFGGYNPPDYPPLGSTDKWWTTNDGKTFTLEGTMPIGAIQHCIAEVRNDGLMWMFGNKVEAGGGGFFVVTLNPATKAWNTIYYGNDLGSYVQWGCFHKNQMYAAFLVGGSNVIIKKSSDGVNWTSVVEVPSYTRSSWMWSDGIRMRYAGGGLLDGDPNTQFVSHVYESLDDGITFNPVSELPLEMRTIWPSYILFDGKEFYFNGAQGGTWGKVYYRELGNGPWIEADDYCERFSKWWEIPIRHASSVTIFKNELYIGLGALADFYKINRVNG